MGTDTYTCGYDPLGNRTSGHGQSVVDYLSSELNQYTNIHNGVTNTPSYDPDGNLIAHGEWSFSWNGENRLTQASNDTTVITYAYDYMGRRFSKTQVSGLSTQTFCYVYDGWNLIQEVTCNSVTPGTSVTNSYVWGLDLSGTLQGAGGVGGLLATVQDGDVYFSCFDANGNLTDYVDENGSNVAHYVYGPFGQTIDSTGDKADDFHFRFSTKYLDEETGLYYYGYRFYSPQLGRWMSRDPLGELGGLNQYGFVRNNPLTYVDELGLIYGTGNPVSGPNGPVGPSDPYGPNPWAPTPPPPPGFHWYGNWGGPGWANGGWNPESGCLPDPGDSDYVPPIDERDACYEDHDRCINGCPECPEDARSDCIEGCDHDLADCLYDLGNPWLWPEAFSFDTWIPCFVH